MASVTSLDKDMRKLRLDRYTDEAANEVRSFIESALGERLQPGDLITALKDGVALCKLINLAAPNTARFKTKAVMPFVQMENISIFLQSCKNPPFSLHSHDVFLTVDLYESKDPAQVLQCIGSFSRAANRVNSAAFPQPIGAKPRPGFVSPQSTGPPSIGGGYRGRGPSNASTSSSTYNPLGRPPSLTPTRTGDSNSGRWSPTKASTPLSGGGGVSSWSKKSDEAATSPAWNISQYGYMGGASQGNLGVSFGGRRQIINAGPSVPNFAEKEKRRREQEVEDERTRVQAEEDERRQQEEEEQREKAAEAQRWADETTRAREQERHKVAEEKRKWEEEEKRWRLEEENRQREEQEEVSLQRERTRARGNSDARLRGQFLSQYQAENGTSKPKPDNPESSRIKELERELEQARERERQYQLERKSRPQVPTDNTNLRAPLVEESKIRPRSRSRPSRPRLTSRNNTQEHSSVEESKPRPRSRSRPRLASRNNTQDQSSSSQLNERDFLHEQWDSQQSSEGQAPPPPTKSPRPLPEPTPSLPPRVTKHNTGSRPLPDPAKYTSAPPVQNKPSPPQPTTQNRTDRYLSSNPAPTPTPPKPTYCNEIGAFDSTSERDAEDRRRLASQTKTKAGGWASKSLLEREMEMERQRQEEWEESQKETKSKVAKGEGVDGIGGGIGGKWDVNQWTGYTGGDGQNRGTQGIGSGRRQIVGPRPPPGGR